MTKRSRFQCRQIGRCWWWLATIALAELSNSGCKVTTETGGGGAPGGIGGAAGASTRTGSGGQAEPIGGAAGSGEGVADAGAGGDLAAAGAGADTGETPNHAAGAAGAAGASGESGAGGADSCTHDPLATSWDVFSDFSPTVNPCGVWSYGYTTSLGSTLILYPQSITYASGNSLAMAWVDPTNITLGAPTLGVNPATGAVLNGATPGQSFEHPGPDGEYSTVRWTAPRAGTYSFDIQFFAGNSGETDGAVLQGTSVLFEQATSTNPTFSATLPLTAGDTFDVAVGITGAETFYYGTTPVTFVVKQQ